MIEGGKSIIWRRLDVPGHEAVRVSCDEDGRFLDGAAVFLHEGKPCRLEYLIECDHDWLTVCATIEGWVGDEFIDREIEVLHNDVWYMNDREIDSVRGFADIDLNFSPVTNILPIRRLNLSVGESRSVTAAWLRFPSFSLEPLQQTYTRKSEFVYAYSSPTGFNTDITVDDSGLVQEYPGVWISER